AKVQYLFYNGFIKSKDQSSLQEDPKISLIGNPRHNLNCREESHHRCQKHLQNLNHVHYVTIFLMPKAVSFFIAFFLFLSIFPTFFKNGKIQAAGGFKTDYTAASPAAES